ncbi:MAG: SigB/SigF/SigG family RNA polymerase sigma factor [Solirubrobacteraceae bacterium]|nr:MAG: B/F/G family RNA polymerase sigma-70 factor [Solirubrobacterales bacterium]
MAISVGAEQPPSTFEQPSALESQALFLRLRASGGSDRETRDALVARFIPLARRLALRYRHGSEPLEDLVQVASLGLVKAVDRFDPERGLAFSSFAVPTILGELKRHFRDHGWSVHVPRGLQERVAAVEQAGSRLGSKLGRPPSVPEICEELHLESEDVVEALTAARAYDAVSLEAGSGASDRDLDAPQALADRLGELDERLELVELAASVAPALAALSARDRLILRLRFIEDLTQQEIAEHVGCSQMQISRLLRRSLARLRAVAEQTEQG